VTKKHEQIVNCSSATLEEQASEAFVCRLNDEWSATDRAELERRLESDPGYADAYRRAVESWRSLDNHAEAPEIMAYREEAIAYARKIRAARWLKHSPYTGSRWRSMAVRTGVALLLAVGWQLSPYGYTPGRYQTDVGEQRMLELVDHSRIALDAATRLRVNYSKNARIVELQKGQAQFFVAKDPSRPFKVVAGDRTIVAVGTVFTVEYDDHRVRVAMMEGQVAVVPDTSASSFSDTYALVATRSQSTAKGSSKSSTPLKEQGSTIELSAGEELQVSRDGRSTVTLKADIEAATAWRRGKVIINTETLGEVVKRLNRYSRLQIQVDDKALANTRISGVFEAGDTSGFVGAIQQYLPVIADYAEPDTVRLIPK
jgi:transmembrane sensor